MEVMKGLSYGPPQLYVQPVSFMLMIQGSVVITKYGRGQICICAHMWYHRCLQNTCSAVM